MEPTPQSGFGLGTNEVKRRHILPKALLVGLVAGLVASVFRLSLGFAEAHRMMWVARLGPWGGAALALGLGAGGGALSLWLVRRFSPESSGSGIPHLKTVLLGGALPDWRRILPVKFIAGVIGIGGGLALGREGPTVQMGGVTGLLVSAWFRVKPGEGERRALMSAGAGAGLAAAFNAPLAGVIFVLEELQGSFTPVIFVAAFLASVAADVVGRLVAGDTPVFHLPLMPSPALTALAPALLLGALAGFGGVLFNRCLLGSLDAFDRIQRGRRWLPGALAGAVAGLAGWFYPGVAGGGGVLTDQALVGAVALAALPALLLVRFGLTMLSYGCGTAGGIFAPLLVLGALGGLLAGHGTHALFPGWAPHPEIYAVLGMGALFTAIVRAPLTGIVLMVELTGQYGFMLPLLVSCLAAYGIAEWLGDVPIYEALRLRAGDGPTNAPAAENGR
jgi:CIC family chloride channel protein